MAKKRIANNELNHDNWDEDEEPEERGIFKTAPKEELQKREIRTARRRRVAGQDSSNTQANTGVFGAFSGFNKAAPSSFDFLSKLTNGAGSFGANGSSSQKDSPVGLLGSSPIASSTAVIGNSPSSEGAKSSLFGVPSNTTMKSVATSQDTSTVTASSKPPTVFGIPSSTSATSMFGTLTTSGSVGVTFGIPPNYSTATSESKTSEVPKSDTQISKNESVFGNLASGSTLFKLPSGSVINTFSTGSKGSHSETPSKRAKSVEKDTSSPKSDAKTQYYSKLKGLNESVSDWIKQHVNENPLCILTPIFKDYEKYLKELEDEKKANESKINAEDNSQNSARNNSIFSSSNTAVTPTTPSSSGFSLNTSAATSAPFSFGITSTSTTGTKTMTSAPSSFVISSVSTTNTNSTTSIPATFSFGTSPGNATAASTQAPFSFGIVSSSNATSTNNNSPAQTPFSFGVGSTFIFNANVQKPHENTENNKNTDEEDEPPKVEFTPIEEENSVFDKKCKVFFKKDGNFVDKGVGTLYIKKIGNGSKHQLIVRANTSLGTLLLNFILNESLPMQRMGKNNVMVVCIPTPDAKPPPVAVLIRVKTSEEADGLLETLNKYKK